MSKLTPVEIQDINRRIAAGTYVHEPDEQVTQEEKPKRGRPPKAKQNDDTVMGGDDE